MLEILNGWVGLSIAIATVLGAVLGPKALPALKSWAVSIWKAILYPFGGTSRLVLEMQNKLQAQEAHLAFIVEQLKPNGGMSLRDSINRIEKRQLLNNNKLNIIIDSSYPMYEMDATGLCIWASNSFLDLTRRNFAEVQNWGWTITVHPEDLDLVRSSWKSCIEDRRAFELRYRIIPKDSHNYLYVVSKASPVTFNGGLVGWIGTMEVDVGGG
jgi:PAS domain-containing protein